MEDGGREGGGEMRGEEEGGEREEEIGRRGMEEDIRG